MNTLRTLLAATVLTFGVAAFAQAAVVESTETDDVLDAVGEVTSSMFINARGTTLTVFVNGTYSADAWLQQEIGSPGSGAWQNIIEVTGADDTTRTISHKTTRDNTNYRVFMSAFTSGDVVAQLTDIGGTGPQTFSGKDFIIHEDDWFTHTAVVNIEWYITDETDAGGTVAVVTPALQEGAVTIISGTGGDDADEVCFSLIDLTDFGALVSDGWTAFETVLKSNVITAQFGMLLHDEECVNAQLTPFDIDSNVVTFDTGNQANSVGIMHSEEADDVDAWEPVCANADAECNNSDEFEMDTVVANTYVRLRVEVQANGDCYMYIDNILRFAENECVATTSRLIPFWWVDTTAADGGDATIDIDYMRFVVSRPSA